jgi:hypothetical protein
MIMVKKSISVFATFILAAVFFAVISPSSAIASPEWWNLSWTCRKSIAITELSGSNLTDHQVKIELNYEPGMQVDFSDIRFIDSDNTVLLSYWCESFVPSTSAIFWVKLSSLPASGTVTVYVYYGNPTAASTSDGWNTFEFFDDFSAGLGQWTIDAENTDKVYISASAGNSSPSLRHDPDSSQTKNSYFDTRLITKDYRMLDGIIEYEVYLAGTQRIIHQLGWRVQSLNFENGYCWRLQTSNADGGHLRFTGKALWSTFGTAFNNVSANTWHSVKEVVSGSTYAGYVDGGGAYSGTNNVKLTEDYLVSHVHGVSLNASSYVLVDNIRVRKYASLEPSCSIGAEEVIIPPTVTTNDVDNVSINTVRLNGILDDLGTATSVNVSFEWGLTPGGPYPNETTPKTTNVTGTFSFDLASLTQSTIYYFLAKAVGDGTGYGVEKNFTTLTSPTVTTNDVGNIGIDTAQLNGTLDDLGTAVSADVSFEWGVTLSGPYPNATTPETVNVTGTYSFSLSSLTENTTYYFRAKAVGDGTGYGVERNFTTLTSPTVTTNDASNIGINAVHLEGNLDDLGTATSANVSFECGVTPGGPYPNETTMETVNVTGTFSFDLFSLTPSTIYYFRAKAVGDGTGYGFEKSFITLTSPTVTTNEANNIGVNAARLNGTLDDLGTATSVNVSFEWGVTPGGPYPNATTQEATNVTGIFNFDLSSLTQSTTYYFRTKAVGHGSSYGTEKSFTTNMYYVEYVDTPQVHYLDINALGLEKSFRIDATGKVLDTIDVTYSDGTLNLYIPKGTVVLDKYGKPLRVMEIAVTGSPPGIPGRTYCVSPAYTLLPGGTTFDPPMTLTWSYDPDTLPDEAHEEELFVAYYDESIGRWSSLGGVVDTLNNTVTAEVSHFTTFALLGMETRPASFTIYNLMINPAKARPGESITVSTSVANTGDLTGSYNIILKIDDVFVDNKEVTIPSGISKAVTFELSKDTVGSYSVDVNGLSGSFVVEVVESETSELTTSPERNDVPELTAVLDIPVPKDYSWLLISSIAAAIILGLALYFLVIRPRMA